MRPTAKKSSRKINQSIAFDLPSIFKYCFFSKSALMCQWILYIEAEGSLGHHSFAFVPGICPIAVCSKCHKKGSETNPAWGIGKEGCWRKNWQEMSELRENVFSLLKKQSSIFSLVEFLGFSNMVRIINPKEVKYIFKLYKH